MTARDFCYWLQGYFEVAGIKTETGCTLTNAQTAAIQRHLALVFAHDIDPQTDKGDPQTKKALGHIHAGAASDKGVLLRC